MNLRKEISCGCIIIKNNQVLLVYSKNGNFWGFPKGHMEPKENEIKDIKWCSFDEAMSILTFDNLKELLKNAIEDIK